MPADGPEAGGIRIPLSNLYYLLCYATNHLEVRGLLDVTAIEGQAPVQLYAALLDTCVGRLRRRGVQRLYRSYDVDTQAPRGRIALAPSIARGLLPRRLLYCEIDALTADVPFNRIVKAALRRLCGHPRIQNRTRPRLRAHVRAFGRIADIAVTPRDFDAARSTRLDGASAFLLHICELVLVDLLIRPGADGEDSGNKPIAFDRWDGTPQNMGRVFESFVLNFLNREQTQFRASKRSRIDWQVTASPSARRMLPRMEGDVWLTRPGQRILIEIKCYRKTLQSKRGGAGKLKSDHLYQLHTYLTHLATDGDPVPTGMLLYAQVERPLRFDYELAGNRILVRSLDLDQPWEGIHNDLLRLVDEASHVSRPS